LLLKLNDRVLQAELKRKSLEEALAVDDERRKRSLLEIKGISQELYDRSLNNLNMIKAEREVIESQLAETEITAPFDGLIGLRYVSEGSVISPSTLVATMQDVDPIKVEFSVPEKYADKLSSSVEIQVEVGESPAPFRGRIYAVESKVDPATRTLKARATVPNSDGRLIPGSFGRVMITLNRIADAIVIPTQALVPELAGQRVFLCRNGAARLIPVSTGIRTDQNIQITQGLSPNDTLILTGLLQLSDGKPVQVRFSSAD
jgi:membrane fusion protein (multidrug efflux system)